jgi:hypothetical protein
LNRRKDVDEKQLRAERDRNLLGTDGVRLPFAGEIERSDHPPDRHQICSLGLCTLRRRNREDRDPNPAQDLFGGGSEEQLLEAAEPLRPDHDQIASKAPGCAKNFIRRIASRHDVCDLVLYGSKRSD